MNKYSIRVSIVAVKFVTVEAESKQDAEDKAFSDALDLVGEQVKGFELIDDVEAECEEML